MSEYLEPKVPQVSADDLKKSLDEKDNVVTLDVRTEGEYSRGKIEGSINIPLDYIPEKVEKSIPDKDSKIFVYCLSGSRSVYAVDEMIKMGYKNVFNLSNGLLVWRAMNFPLVS